MKQRTSSIDPRQKVVAADLHRLNAIESGLGSRAVRYVFDGEDHGVLDVILDKSHGGELEALQFSRCQTTSRERRRLLAQHTPFDVPFARRYGQVLNANFGNGVVPGRSSSPADLRILFFEALAGLSDNLDEPASFYTSRGLTLASARELVSACEGDVTDLLDILFQVSEQPTRYLGHRYRGWITLMPLYIEETDSVIRAAEAFSAAGKADIINDLRRLDLCANETYLDWLLRQSGSSAKRVREASTAAILSVPEDAWAHKAISHLQSGNLQTRLSMVLLLSSINAEDALTECRKQQPHEKVAAAIDAALLGLTLVRKTSNIESYRAVDDSLVEIPKVLTLPDSDWLPGEKEHGELLAIIDASNKEIRAHNAAHPNQHYKSREIDRNLANDSMAMFTDPSDTRSESSRWEQYSLLGYGAGSRWARTQLERMATSHALRVCLRNVHWVDGVLDHGSSCFNEFIADYLSSEPGDLRQLETMLIAMGIPYRERGSDTTRAPQSGDILRVLLSTPYFSEVVDEWSNSAIWPYIAEHLDIIDEAFGLRESATVSHFQKSAAVDACSILPKAPAQHFQPLLQIATGEAKTRAAEARKLLNNAININEQLAALLRDSAQSTRSNSAKWLADKAAHEAIPAIKKQLQREKNEMAKAACLSSLAALGEDLDQFLDAKILLNEAIIGLKKRKQSKLDWINWSEKPRVRDISGKELPQQILEWWAELAVKLKQAGGSPLFDLYMARLNPEDACHFGSWLLEAWLDYDTCQPKEEDAEFHAHRHLGKHYETYSRVFRDYSKADALAELKKDYMSRYPNSGAATKGLLALTKLAPASFTAEKGRSYLKNHGARTSQAGALLEMMAARKDTVTLQVLLACATRSKQKSLQKLAQSLVDEIAAELNWSVDELADRTIAIAGLDDEGNLALPCGSQAKPYQAKLNKNTLLLELRNPEGKSVKSLPNGEDENTKASKKLLSTSRRELKAIIQMQKSRLYEALCAGRTWSFDAWERDLASHPIVSSLIERLVWVATEGSGDQSFRLQGKQYLSASDHIINPERCHEIKLAHSMVVDGQEEQDWMRCYQEGKFEALFPQFGRSMLAMNRKADDRSEINDREGWLTDTFTLKGRANRLGYERGEIVDAGAFYEYRKTFRATGVCAVINFSGSAVPEENLPAALISLSFQTHRDLGRPKPLALSAVPPILLSECWNDYRDMASNAEFDPNWRDKVEWM